MTGGVSVLIGVVSGLVFIAGCGHREVHFDAVKVRASAIYCIFDQSCAVPVTDSSTAPIPMQTGGTAFLESRTFAGKPGTPAAGLYGYEYRIDLEKAVETTADAEDAAAKRIRCLRSMMFEFGPIIDTLDYNGDGKSGDLIYVITSGGPGKIGIEHAHRWGNRIILYFGSPICVGVRGSQGDSTYFFGLVSAQPPRSVTATLKETDDLSAASSKLTNSPVYNVLVRVPQIGAASGPNRPGSP